MNVLFCGLGSIGTRHLKNLTAVCAARGLPLACYALRSSARALPGETAALLAGEFTALPAACGDGPDFDVAFITGPTHLHAAQIEALKGRAGTFFIEKPIFESPAYDLVRTGLWQGQKAYVAAPMRFCGAYRKAKALLGQGLPVYAVRAICSSYLPDWRPAQDYTQNYSAIRAMGGGVKLDLIHEWDYLTDLFGPPAECRSFAGKYSSLAVSSDDLAVYIARYPAFLCEVHLDYFGRQYRRTLEVFSEDGCLTADFYTGIVTAPNGQTHNCAEDANARYMREMEYFVTYAQSGEATSINSPARALDTLKIALGQQ